MHTEREVRVEPLTEEAFAPFGQIISPSGRAPDFRTLPSSTKRTSRSRAIVRISTERPF